MNRLNETFKYIQNRHYLLAQVMVLLMMACVNIILVQTAAWMSSKYDSKGMVIFGILVSLEALVSSYVFHTQPLGVDRIPFLRLAEWVVIILMVKLFTEIRLGIDYLIQNIISWPESFPSNFITQNFLFNIIISLIIWLITTAFIHDLQNLVNHMKEIQEYQSQKDYQTKSASNSLRERYLSVGALIAFMAGIMRQSIFALSSRTPPIEFVVSLVLDYFFLGMVLLSLTHFSNLLASWGIEQFKIHKNMALRWITYFSVFLGCLGIVILILPTNYSMDLFATIRILLGWLFEIIKFLILLILFPFFWIFNQVNQLLGKPIAGPAVSYLPPQLKIPEQGFGVDLPGWDVLKSILFWIIFLIILVLSVRQYVLANRRLSEIIRRWPFVRWIKSARDWLLMQIKGVGHGIRGLADATGKRLRLNRSSLISGHRWRYINPNRMTPNQQIVFFYLSMLRRAGEAGIGRKSWETPYEFARHLQLNMPDEKNHVSTITDAFMEARYSQHEISSEFSATVRAMWIRLTGILRRIGRWGNKKEFKE